MSDVWPKNKRRNNKALIDTGIDTWRGKVEKKSPRKNKNALIDTGIDDDWEETEKEEEADQQVTKV